ncbi:MAG: hypothetical protein GEU75_11160 [Dehalococcoidia bacterium]|nr:hypothetical protein [Dehalococcoidia bacterium]
MDRTCAGIAEGGARCRQAPMRGEEFCFWHHPDYKEEAAQARKVGGQRRRRERAIEGAYELEGLDSVAGIRRYLEIAMADALNLENSVQRVRAVIAGVMAATKLLEVGEHEDRIAAIEAALGPRVVKSERRR